MTRAEVGLMRRAPGATPGTPVRTPIRARDWLGLGWFGVRTVLTRRPRPIVGSVILTDRCNLACAHCAVSNLRRTDYPFSRVRADLQSLRAQGVRIVFLYGGEPYLWHDHDLTLRDVVGEARRIGFLLVNVVTNGTHPLDLPGADVIMVSVDGSREHHDQIRGRTYDRVLAHVLDAPERNVVLYMAVNRINRGDLGEVAELARSLRTVRAVSFNLHTPYPGTEHLTLSREERREACAQIARLIDDGYPVMNLASALPYVAEGNAPIPCRQCVVVEDGQQWDCGRCIEVPGLCAQCGFLFATELALVFHGHPRVVADALRTYRAVV